MEKVILVRFGEIFLKGENKGWFERKLLDNMRRALAKFGCEIQKTQGRYIVSVYPEKEEAGICAALSKIFVIHSYSVAVRVESELSVLVETAAGLLTARTFKVETNRADKRFPLNSMQVNCEVGAQLLALRPGTRVDVKRPEQVVHIDMRENGYSYLFTKVIECERGMPYATSGKGVLLLSGGIDSPVAGYLMAKRGMEIVGLHFHSYPYTSEMARQKVYSLAKTLAGYCGKIRLYVVSVTDIQVAIHEKCHENMLITILRRFMMRIANEIVRREDAQAIVTGESLAQVASQTAESIVVTNACAQFPVLRPLIGTDKQDIVEISQKIGAFETSILPYEDCCTVFLPKNPVIRPKLSQVAREEQKLDVAGLVSAALAGLEIVEIDA